ncbi:hypothetical protein P3G55_03725 [Leptospira sp. 96542]|nr:hypothetical protein [Leptospira sp. 96542]
MQRKRAYATNNGLSGGKFLICGGNDEDWIDTCEILTESSSKILVTKLY